MCKGLRDLITDSKAEGHKAGLTEGRAVGLIEGRAEALVHTYQKFNQPKESAIDALIDEYSVAKDEAIELVEKYWQ